MYSAHTYMGIHMHACMPTCVGMRACICMQIYTHTCTHTQASTHAHTIHTRTIIYESTAKMCSARSIWIQQFRLIVRPDLDYEHIF